MKVGKDIYAIFYHPNGLTAFYTPSHGENPVRLQAMAAIALTLMLLEYLANYANVFLNENASILLAHNKLNHAIETENGEPPFRPLYNLSQSKLQVLCTYLEESTREGWIQRSTSLVGALVLF
jgi:hypothetical protein